MMLVSSGLGGAPEGAARPVPPLAMPGVYPAQRDTWLLAHALDAELRPGLRVLEIGTGSGALAVRAACRARTQVTAVDVSRRALVATWVNARRHRVEVRLRRGDLIGPVADEGFDLVVSNPPYVPAVLDLVPARGRARAWDAGHDGRLVLDRLCAEAPKLLGPGGVLLIVQSSLSGVDATMDQLAGDGLAVSVVARCEHPFGPVLRARAPMLEARGFIERGQRTEELVVIRGVRP